jgi:GNAT superfamily N-acetyltransferase
VTDDRLEIRELSPGLTSDYLHFFDHDAFADNLRWAACYCHFNYAPHHLKDWQERTADENRAAVSRRCAEARMHGYLAYWDAKPVGWCCAGPRASMTTLPAHVPAASESVGSIMCFVVAKPHRGKGVARRLLAAACDGFREKGFAIAEAYPRREAKGDAANYHGPLALYLAAGFEACGEEEGVLTVRKRLA